MTDDQKRLDKAALLLEYQEAEDEVGHLFERSHKITGALDELLRTIRPDLSVLIDEAHAHYDQKTISEMWGYGKVEQMRKALDIDAMLNLADEIRKAKWKLAGLKQRKQALGLR